MEQTQPSRLSDRARKTTAKAFGDWLAERMRERDYAMPPHGRGGVRRLAERAGLSPSVVSNLLRGETPTPTLESLRAITDVLGLPFPEVVVRAGIFTAAELRAYQTSDNNTGRPPVTTESAAADLDIDTTDPVAMAMFESAVSGARELRKRRLDRERAD